MLCRSLVRRCCAVGLLIFMGITVTLARNISDKDFQQVEDLVRHLQGTDYNFSGRAIWVERGAVTAVHDPKDALRAALLQLMVDGMLRVG